MHMLKDGQNRAVAGNCHEQKLVNVRHPDIYLIEKVLKTGLIKNSL